MDFSSINWLAVVACVVVSMISGGLWFGPKTFFPAWWKAIGKTEKDTPGGDNMAVMWGGTVLAAVVVVDAHLAMRLRWRRHFWQRHRVRSVR